MNVAAFRLQGHIVCWTSEFSDIAAYSITVFHWTCCMLTLEYRTDSTPSSELCLDIGLYYNSKYHKEIPCVL